MTSGAHQDVCEAIQLVTDATSATSQHSGERPFLCEWREWARVVAAGLYCAKTADRAAQSALAEAHAEAPDSPLAAVARAAALIALSVFHAVQKDEETAREKIACARSLLQTTEARGRLHQPRARARLSVVRGHAESHDHEQAAAPSAAPRCRPGKNGREHVRLRA